MKETFSLAAHGFAELVSWVPDQAWDGPGLGTWDLRSLVGHTSRALITVDTYLDRPAQVERLSSPDDYYRATFTTAAADPEAVAERGRQAGLALGDDPATAVRALVERVLPKVMAAEDRVIETIAGGMLLSTYLPTRTFELVVHSFDISSAARLDPPPFYPSVLADVASIAARAAVAQGSGPEVILALTGRRPLPASFSVV